MANIKLEEGTIFAVQLDNGNWAVGVLARKSPKRGRVVGIYGFFFGAFRMRPAFERIHHLLNWKDATVILKCGALHLHQGIWPIIGSLNPWNRNDWPLVRFLRIDALANRNYCVTYDEDDIFKAVSEVETNVLEGLIPDASSGDRAAEIHLSRALHSIVVFN